MINPIQGLILKEIPDSPARAYLEVIQHRIEYPMESEESLL